MNRTPSDSIFWVSARSSAEITADFQAIAERLSLTQESKDRRRRFNQQNVKESMPRVGVEINSIELLKQWMLSTDHEEWLMVLDNYDDVHMDIRKFLPIGFVGRILVTSRDRRIIGSVADCGFELSGMGFEDAKHLFLRVRGQEIENEVSSPSDSEELGKILQELHYFPLAIDQAASFIRENSPMTYPEYFELLKPRSTDRERLMRFKEANPMYPESVMTTWEISFRHLQRHQSRAAWILQVLGFLDYSHVAEGLLTSVNKVRPWVLDSFLEDRLPSWGHYEDLRYLDDDVEFRLAVGALSSLSLIKRNALQQTLYVHPLVHEWTRARLSTEPSEQARFTITVTLIMYQSFPLEVVTSLPIVYSSITPELHQRIDQVSHHLRAVLANLKDYCQDISLIPIECFTLLEVCHLTGTPGHAIFGHELPEDLFVELDATIRRLIPTLPQTYQQLAFCIHKITIWLRSKDDSESIPKVLSKIANSLESLQLALPFETEAASFIMILCTTVIDASESTSMVFGEGIPFVRMHSESVRSKLKGSLNAKTAALRDPPRERSLRLLKGVYSILLPVRHESRLMHWVTMMIQYRLLGVMTSGELATWILISRIQRRPRP